MQNSQILKFSNSQILKFSNFFRKFFLSALCLIGVFFNELKAQWTTQGSNNIINTNSGKVGIGVSGNFDIINNSTAKFIVNNDNILGSSNGSSLMIASFSSSNATNIFKNNKWVFRDATGSDWLTTRLHDAISIDNSYLTPGTNTRTWWERDPLDDIQSWGTGSSTYFTIKAGKIGIGTINPVYGKLQINGAGANDGIAFFNTTETLNMWMDNSSSIFYITRGTEKAKGLNFKADGRVRVGGNNDNWGDNALFKASSGATTAFSSETGSFVNTIPAYSTINAAWALFSVCDGQGATVGTTQLNGIDGRAYGNGYGTTYAYGVSGLAGQSGHCYGVYGESYSGTIDNWAGYFAGNVYAYSFQPSDLKLKKDVNSIETPLNKIIQLQPKTFHYKSDSKEYESLHLPKNKSYGLIAQDVEKIFPEIIQTVTHPPKYNKDGEIISDSIKFKSLNYTELIPIIVAAIQEQETLNKKKDSIISKLAERITVLEKIVDSSRVGDSENNFVPDFENNNDQMSSLELFPNPFENFATIRYNISQNFKSAYLNIRNLQGDLIKQYDINSNNIDEIKFSTANKTKEALFIVSLVVDGKIIISKRLILK